MREWFVVTATLPMLGDAIIDLQQLKWSIHTIFPGMDGRVVVVCYKYPPTRWDRIKAAKIWADMCRWFRLSYHYIVSLGRRK